MLHAILYVQPALQEQMLVAYPAIQDMFINQILAILHALVKLMLKDYIVTIAISLVQNAWIILDNIVQAVLHLYFSYKVSA